MRMLSRVCSFASVTLGLILVVSASSALASDLHLQCGSQGGDFLFKDGLFRKSVSYANASTGWQLVPQNDFTVSDAQIVIRGWQFSSGYFQDKSCKLPMKCTYSMVISRAGEKIAQSGLTYHTVRFVADQPCSTLDAGRTHCSVHREKGHSLSDFRCTRLE
jgi:hypothetical protein